MSRLTLIAFHTAVAECTQDCEQMDSSATTDSFKQSTPAMAGVDPQSISTWDIAIGHAQSLRV